MAKVVILRFSALGDVAMTIPIIYSVAKANLSDSFTVVTQPFLIPLFINRPPNVEVFGIDTKGSEKSLAGLRRFARRLAGQRFDVAIDLHNVIRSRLIDMALRLRGTRVFVMDKLRKERRQLTKKPPKVIAPLRTTLERYMEVFHAANFRFTDTFTSLFADKQEDSSLSQSAPDSASPESIFTSEKKGRWIGIAPFAKHAGKIYPIDEMEKVVDYFSRQPDTTLFFFGGGKYEEAVLSQWEFQCINAYSVAGRYSLRQELELISRLDVMVCMDSANMHFASLVGVKAVSIWGATHPYTGFYGYKQDPRYAVQVDLPCRPCSIYGKKPCYRGDYACLKQIAPEQIIDKVNEVLAES